MNSIKSIMKAIEYESARQVKELENGNAIVQETRLFNIDTNKTMSMRSKEESDDYRYFPDPNLPPISLTQHYIDDIREHMPELPDARKKRYVKEMGMSEYDASVLVADKAVSDYFESAAKGAKNHKMTANWIIDELFGRMNKTGITIDETSVTPENLSELINLIEDDTISGKIAKDVFDIMFETGKDPEAIVQEKGWKQVSDESEITSVIVRILQSNMDSVQKYHAGKDKLLGFFVGQIMKEMKGKANPKVANALLLTELDKLK